MLDTFLEVVCSKTKEAEARDRQVELLRKLPDALLHKIASGEEKLSYMEGIEGGGQWIDRFKGTALFAKAIELCKSELQLDIQAAEEDANRPPPTMNETWRERDNIRIQKKMLDLELLEHEQGAELPEAAAEEPVDAGLAEEADPAAAQPPMGAAPVVPEGADAEADEPPPAKKPPMPPKKPMSGEDLAKAAMAMRMKLAHAQLVKEALPNPLPALAGAAKGIGNFASTAGKSVATAYKGGGLAAAGQAAGNAGRSGLMRAGNYARQNPGMAMGMAAAGGVGAGYLGSKMAGKRSEK